MTSVGSRERRILLSMQVTLGPLTHSILTTTLAVFMLSTSPFEFVIRHFFWLLLVVLCVGAFNSLVVFPIVLSLIGPEAELVPLKYPDRISTPSPQMARSNKRANKTVIVHGGSSRSSSRNCQKPHYHHKDVNINDPSLTTITEEPPSWKSSNSSIQMNNEWSGNNNMVSGGGAAGNGINAGVAAGHYGNNINYGNNMNYHHLHAPPPTPPQQQQQPQQPPPTTATSTQAHHSHHQHQHHPHYNPLYATHPPPPPPPQYQQQHHLNTGPSTPCNLNSAAASHHPPNLGHENTNSSNNKNMNNFPPELQSIVVQPEVTVETHHSDTNTTKVTATANIKVELVTPGRAVRSYNFTS